MAKDKRPESGAPPLEWAAASLGAAFALAIMGFVLWEGLTRRDTPPDIRVEVVRAYAAQGGHAVEFLVVNDGGEPAAEVRVGAAGAGPDRVVSFDILPAGSRRRGVLILPRPPEGSDPRLSVLGYREP